MTSTVTHTVQTFYTALNDSQLLTFNNLLRMSSSKREAIPVTKTYLLTLLRLFCPEAAQVFVRLFHQMLKLVSYGRLQIVLIWVSYVTVSFLHAIRFPTDRSCRANVCVIFFSYIAY